MKKIEKLLVKKDEMKLKGKVIPATFDPVFKSVMTSCQGYLSSILQGIIKDVSSDVFSHLVIQNNEFSINSVVEKKKITDVIVKVENMVINLEMNSKYYHGLFEKNESYLRKIGAQMFVAGEDYTTDKKLIQINFDNFKVYDERIIIKFQIADTERGIIELDSYEKYHVSLANLKDKYYNEENLSFLERALLLLTANTVEMLEKLSKGDEVLMEAARKIESLSTDLDILGLYDEEENRKLEAKLIREYEIKLAREEGLASGRKEGLASGRKEGLASGRKEGLAIGRKKAKDEYDKKILSIVKNMLSMDIPIESISASTGISKEKIELLQKN